MPKLTEHESETRRFALSAAIDHHGNEYIDPEAVVVAAQEFTSFLLGTDKKDD